MYSSQYKFLPSKVRKRKEGEREGGKDEGEKVGNTKSNEVNRENRPGRKERKENLQICECWASRLR